MDQDELLRVIEKARQSGATELDLSRRGITDLPPEIGQLTGLTWLDLSYNCSFANLKRKERKEQIVL